MKYINVILKNVQLIHQMAVHKLKSEYAEQAFGFAWAIINPLVYVFSFWFFFAVGVKKGAPINGNPYIIWLFPGVLSFRHLSSMINHSTKHIAQNKMLVKTIKFPVMTLPIIETLKEMYVHILVMGVMCILFTVIGYSLGSGLQYMPDIYYLNLIYYWIVMFAFGVAMSLILSPLGVLLKDTKNLVSAIMQPLFWITPVLYAVNDINDPSPTLELLQKLLNPLYFFVYGYRQTFLYDAFFFEDPLYNLYIWIVIGIMFVIGMNIWKKTRELMPDLM